VCVAGAHFYRIYDLLKIKENKNEENFSKKGFEENISQMAHFQRARFMTVSEDR